MNRDVLILGNPLLRKTSLAVSDFRGKETLQEIEDLNDSLAGFRQKHGFGRGMAAIQVGIEKRIIALNLGKGAFVIINPEITWRSEETFTLWDDCMSFPDLVVKVRRNKSITVEYQDPSGKRQKMERMGQAESELLQHEIDHLDGIMAVDRALDGKDIMYKREYEKHHEYYGSQVDYEIKPTI
jgi:peptide deformylase